MDKIKFALVGCGRIGNRHAEHINTYGTLVAVCDIVEEKAIAIATQYKAKSYSSIEKLLDAEKEIDVLSVCTPNGLHATHSIQGLKAGINILCEKPMAITSEDCAAMMKEADKASRGYFP